MNQQTAVQIYLNNAPERILTCTKCQRYITHNYDLKTNGHKWLFFGNLRSTFVELVSERMPNQVILPVDRVPSNEDFEAFMIRECIGRIAMVAIYDSNTHLQKMHYYFEQPNDALFFKMYFH